jgi:hypothetical protein
MPMKLQIKVLRMSVRRLASKIKRAIKPFAPVGDHGPIKHWKGGVRQVGYLRSHISVKGGRALPYKTTMFLRPPYYHRFLEKGTKKMSAKPWLGRAWNSINREELVKDELRFIKEAIIKLATKK